MFALNRWARMLTCVAAFGMVASPVLGATPIATTTTAKKTQSNVFDVKLAQGQLIGQVMKATGTPEAGAMVSLSSRKDVLGNAKTDKLGRFALPIAKSGVYQVVVADRAFTIRAWQPEVAPPNAKTGLLCVTQDIVRGQCGGCGSLGACAPGCGMAAPSCGLAGPSCGIAGPSCGAPCGPACGPCGGGGCGLGGGGLMSILTNPVVIGLGVAAAIAIPIALDDDDDDDNNGGGAGAGGAGEPAS